MKIIKNKIDFFENRCVTLFSIYYTEQYQYLDENNKLKNVFFILHFQFIDAYINSHMHKSIFLKFSLSKSATKS